MLKNIIIFITNIYIATLGVQHALYIMKDIYESKYSQRSEHDKNIKSAINKTNQNQSKSVWLSLTLSFEFQVRREGMAEFEIISCSCLKSFPDKMKIRYKLKIFSIVYAKCRCLPRMTMLNKILLEIEPTAIAFLCY